MCFNKYVIHYDGLLKTNCFRIVSARNIDEAEAEFNNRFKARRRITKTELFTSMHEIAQIQEKRSVYLSQISQGIHGVICSKLFERQARDGGFIGSIDSSLGSIVILLLTLPL